MGLLGQNSKRDARLVHRVARALLDFDVALKQDRIVSGRVPQIILAAHDAEHARESLVPQLIGGMAMLPGPTDDSKDIFSTKLMDGQPLPPVATRERIPLAALQWQLLGSPGAFLGSDAHAGDDGSEPVCRRVAANLSFDWPALQIGGALPVGR